MTSEQMSKIQTVIVVITNASTNYYFVTNSINDVMNNLNSYQVFFKGVDGSSIKINMQIAASIQLWPFDKWRESVSDYQLAQITGIDNYS